jgi:hypothetical protein
MFPFDLTFTVNYLLCLPLSKERLTGFSLKIIRVRCLATKPFGSFSKLLPVLPLLKQLGPYQTSLDTLHLNSMLFICKINIHLSTSWIFPGHLCPDKRSF